MDKNQTKKSQKRLVKEEKVKQLSESFLAAKNLIFWDYQGLTVPQFEKLREELQKAEAKVTVYKNTLINLALKARGLKVADEKNSPGPTAVLISPSDIEPLKILANFIKNTGVGKLKFGFFERNFQSANDLEFLANLPSRQVVMGQIINLLYTPIYNLANLFEGNLKNLVQILAARR